MRLRKFFGAFALLVLVLAATLKMKLFLGWTPDLVFALLVVFGLVLSFPEVLFLSAFTAWVLNWQPWPGPELMIMVAVALISYFGRYFMPFERWLSLIVLTAGGLVLMYLVAAPRELLEHWPWMALDIAISTIFGFVVLRVFRFFYGKPQG